MSFQANLSDSDKSAAKAGDASVDTLRDDLDTLRKDVSALLSDTKSIAKDKIREGVDKGKEAASDARESIEDITSKLETKVRDNPVAAIAIAFGAGVVLSALSRR